MIIHDIIVGPHIKTMVPGNAQTVPFVAIIPLRFIPIQHGRAVR